MATITGFIEKIKFRNEENGYTVLSVTDQSDGDEVIMVGTLSYAAEGDMIQASGRMIEHPVYGEQLQIESYEMKTPQDAESMEPLFRFRCHQRYWRSTGSPYRPSFQSRHFPGHGRRTGAPFRSKRYQ